MLNTTAIAYSCLSVGGARTKGREQKVIDVLVLNGGLVWSSWDGELSSQGVVTDWLDSS